jgi:hypothetical protein
VILLCLLTNKSLSFQKLLENLEQKNKFYIAKSLLIDHLSDHEENTNYIQIVQVFKKLKGDGEEKCFFENNYSF